MSNHTQRMNGMGLAIGAFRASLQGENVNSVERSSEEHEQAVLRMIERQERGQDLWTGEQLEFCSNVGEWHSPDGEEIEENDELDLDNGDDES